MLLKFLIKNYCLGMACLVFCFLPRPAYALPEVQLKSAFKETVLPYFNEAKKRVFIGKDQIPIAWRVFAPGSSPTAEIPRGAKTILLLNGRTEFMRKYAELIYDLRDAGYVIYTMDHRGQGESGRMLSEPLKGYVKDFHDYVDDLDTFVKDVVQKNAPSEIHVIAHSMGAAIATIYAIEHPESFRSMTLSSPMYQPNLHGYPEVVALAITWLYRLMGHEDDLGPGQRLDQWQHPFDHNQVTHSVERYGYAHEIENADPSLAIGGATVRWIEQAILGGKWIRSNASRLTTPIRILAAGDETVVMSAAEEEVCHSVMQPKNCDWHFLEGARHEIFMETDAIRGSAMSLTLDWIAKHGAS